MSGWAIRTDKIIKIIEGELNRFVLEYFWDGSRWKYMQRCYRIMDGVEEFEYEINHPITIIESRELLNIYGLNGGDYNIASVAKTPQKTLESIARAKYSRIAERERIEIGF